MSLSVRRRKKLERSNHNSKRPPTVTVSAEFYHQYVPSRLLRTGLILNLGGQSSRASHFFSSFPSRSHFGFFLPVLTFSSAGSRSCSKILSSTVHSSSSGLLSHPSSSPMNGKYLSSCDHSVTHIICGLRDIIMYRQNKHGN